MDEDFIWIDEAASRVGLTYQRVWQLIQKEAAPCASESIGKNYKSRKIPNSLYVLWLEIRIKQKLAKAREFVKEARKVRDALSKFKKDKGL